MRWCGWGLVVFLGCADVAAPMDTGGDASTDARLDAAGPDMSADMASADVSADMTSTDVGADMPSADMPSADTEIAAPPYPDLELGPYESLVTIFVDNALRNSAALDTSTEYGQSAAQGYVLQAIGEVLLDADGFALEGRDALVEAALGEIDELRAADADSTHEGPAFGLPGTFDAFGDGSVNPARTPYTWQSGMVALGVAKVARALVRMDHPRAVAVRDYGMQLVRFWDAYYSSASPGGYWWYSALSVDAKAVHNTSALIAMAAHTLSEAGATDAPTDRARAVVDLLWARMRGNPTSGYEWNYVDDGYPESQRRAEDISHAAVTVQLMRTAGHEEWWSASQMRGVAQTLLTKVWSGNPARLRGFVDGRSADADWTYTRAAVIGFAAHGDSPGGDPRVFDLARSILFSSYMGRFERQLESPTVDSARLLAVALLLTHRPDAFVGGSRFAVSAGPGDDALPTEADVEDGGGVRFYTVDWEEPRAVGDGLVLPARSSSAANANFLVDLAPGVTGRVLVSVVYRSATTQTVAQWDGGMYRPIGTLALSRDEDGVERWFRTTFELGPDRFDYQEGVPGVNVLLQIPSVGTRVHSIDATPL